jgi:adenine-specific DNA-methyltransferase
MINKLSMKSKDIISDNIDKISELFPNCISEGKINFEMLKQELSKDIIEDGKEKYQLTWVGKRESIVNANTPTENTLRPVKEKSVDFDNTKNIYIEGDNLDVLKILQESYLNKIKCIYIDPPYNTGNDFIYNDKFINENELEESGQIDEYENRLISNTESNGKFHSDWLSMMYSRLKIARNLLTADGSIYISIDDNEYDNLKKICDEIFGENNFVANLVWQKNFAPKNDNKYISISTEYVLVYAKNKEKFNRGLLPREEKHNKGYSNPDNDIRGLWTSGSMLATTYSASGVYEIIAPNGKKHLPPAGRCWRFAKDTIEQLKKENKIWFGADGSGVPRIKRFLSEMPNEIVPQNLMLYTEVGSNQDGNLELRELFDAQIFDYPKNTKLLNRIFTIANVKENDIVLDFFSGSATTAQALLKKNAKENLNIKFILIQIAERYRDKSGKYNFETICDLGEERIRRAGKKIKEETNADIDYGFRVYKVDSSNMKDVYYTPTELQQSQLNMFESNVKEDRTAEDLLIQVILDLGLTLDLSIEKKKILNNNVYFVESNSLVACFDDTIDINIIDEICKYKPLKIVFKESSFKTDNDKINTFEKIKKMSPETEVNII